MRRIRLICLLTILVMSVLVCVPAFALDPSTLCYGSRGEEVRRLQQALIQLGFLSGSADGVFGNKTEEAVRKFQKANHLEADGLAGKKTQAILFAADTVNASAGSSSSAASPASVAESAAPVSQTPASDSGSVAVNLFSGNYRVLSLGSTGSRVKILQQALISLNYLSGTVTGKYDDQTKAAVLAFQKQNRLYQDGVAGKDTLTALETAVSVGAVNPSSPVSVAQASQASSETAPAAESTPSSGALFSGNYSTLRLGSSGSRVKILQQALISLNYLSGTPDGKFGSQTMAAVLSFQQQNNLSADGVAGKSTLTALEAAVSGRAVNSSSSVPDTQASQVSSDPAPVAENASPETLFSGNYTTLRLGSSGSRVKILQQALISLNYLSGTPDGKFGNQTLIAVQAFQKQHNLSQDGVAGKKTLAAIETAVKNGDVFNGAAPSSAQPESAQSVTPAASSTVTVAKVSAPDSGSIRLLHWFNDVKPALKNGDHLLIYDPSTGLSWTLRVMSRGRHCDCEPLTRADTETMVKAFGDKNTWNQKGVYVKLPGGTWTIGSTHDMPHMSGSIKDNGFDGHLCVHFLRDMDEAKANDPNYGVSNQETIRALWKSISGEEITY